MHIMTKTDEAVVALRTAFLEMEDVDSQHKDKENFGTTSLHCKCCRGLVSGIGKRILVGGICSAKRICSCAGISGFKLNLNAAGQAS